jgi:hypothetical protein
MMRTLARDRAQELMILLGTMRAEQRIATFLLDLSERYGRSALALAVVLRMTRQDIGSYLGLQLETVSRFLQRFQQEGFIRVQGKSIALLDFPALWRLSGLSPDRQSRRPIRSSIGKASCWSRGDKRWMRASLIGSSRERRSKVDGNLCVAPRQDGDRRRVRFPAWPRFRAGIQRIRAEDGCRAARLARSAPYRSVRGRTQSCPRAGDEPVR